MTAWRRVAAPPATFVWIWEPEEGVILNGLMLPMVEAEVAAWLAEAVAPRGWRVLPDWIPDPGDACHHGAVVGTKLLTAYFEFEDERDAVHFLLMWSGWSGEP